MLKLDGVTLFGMHTHDPKGIKKAAEISQEHIEYESCLIITDDIFTKVGSAEKRRSDYSRFMIVDLPELIKTPYTLTIQTDGYVLNPDAWDDSFFGYDYIGAKWWYSDGFNVGNGGFSFRSKRLLNALSEINRKGFIKKYHPEDDVICRKLRPMLEVSFGIRFAPNEVADKFSIEAWSGKRKYDGSFGFHGGNIDFSILPPEKRPYALPKHTSKRELEARWSAAKNKPYHPVRTIKYRKYSR